MNKNVVKDFYTVEKNDRNVKIPYYYFSGEKYKKREIRERVENAVFTVVVIPKVNFITRMKFTKTGSEEDEYKETVTDWPEITSFYIRTFEDEKEF
ncbi:MAG: hypothetical protein N3A54_02985, partial [Patescibacteria group bacterium]|nr:hypothetical protein [Patescibacteria group bacterium]